MTLERLAPGSICHAPKEAPEFAFRTFCNRFAFFMTDAMMANLGQLKPLNMGSKSFKHTISMVVIKREGDEKASQFHSPGP